MIESAVMSIAGLLAARVLAGHARRVVVIEHDLPGIRGAHRPGVPQGRHLHTLLPGGREWLERWLRGLTENMADDGAVMAGPRCPAAGQA